ncbi:GPI-anchored cell wall organization protein ecm33 [Xylaria sp. CBS 124048]|nr:GPI-anchored cell wall organization protein ecm33 [Xylaria sp. CBS 124048]
MYSKELFAVAALGFASGAAAVGCKDDPVVIRNQQDADQVAKCSTIPHDLVLDTSAGPAIDLGSTLTEIQGSLQVNNNGLIQTLSCESLKTIGNTFQLHNLTSLTSLMFTGLEEVGSIDWITLSKLPEPTFGEPGITKAQSIMVSDTFIENLNGLNVQNVADMNINNNHRLTLFSTSIKTLSNVLLVNDNGLNLTMEMPNLEWIANMTIANVSSFSVPSLKTVNGSMRFDSNYFTDFLAANLTTIQDGDLSFVSNPDLLNISIPLLEKVGGGFTIANNTALGKVNGFGSLKDVGGAILMRGSFDDIELNALTDVVGTAQFISTEDISTSCKKLQSLSGNVVQGTVTTCRGNDAGANNGTSSDDSGSGSGSGGNGEGAASLASASMTTVVTLATLGGLVAAFL